MKKRFLIFVVIVVSAATLAGCSHESSSTPSALEGLGTEATPPSGNMPLDGSVKTVSGIVSTGNGDAFPSVTVYIPGALAASPTSKATRMFNKSTTSTDGKYVCEDPPAADSALVVACTSADGSFSLETSGITTNPKQIVFVRGNLKMIQSLGCSAAACVLASSTTQFGSTTGTTTWPKIAVVTGNWDRMEDVLAKIADLNTADGVNGGYGRVSTSTGRFVYGSEYGTNMTIIDGTGNTVPTENTGNVTYKRWSNYLDGTESLLNGSAPVFDIIFINCGNIYDLPTNLNADAITRLQNYVNAGGRLYVTDLSYDFVEQAFPQVMWFEGDTDSITTPGAFKAAYLGSPNLAPNATVDHAGMLKWLKNISVNRHDASTPGNPTTDCSAGGNLTYDQYASAVTSSNLIPIGDFFSDWAEMHARHSADSDTIIWIKDGGGTTGLADRPLTVSRTIGSNNGKIFYSSYHTANSCPSLTFWPQERVLQYLIFEAF